MDQRRYRRKMITMVVMILLAILYSVLLYLLRTLTGERLLDGGIGVILGLYICSHPAANAIDLIFMQRVPAEWSSAPWLTLNMLTMFAGWVVIVIGAGRFYYG